VRVRVKIMNAKCVHSLIVIMTDTEVMKFSNCRSCSGCTDRSQHSCGGQIPITLHLATSEIGGWEKPPCEVWMLLSIMISMIRVSE